MSNRNRKLYIALGIAGLILAVFVGWSLHSFWEYQKDHAQKRQNISAYQAETSEQYPEVCFNENASVLSLLKCLVNTVDANRNAQRTQYDLQAQQEMAEWAYGLLLLTAAGLFASIIGLVALFNSLGLSRRALLLAVRGNRNAIRAINQEQANAQRELRAYLSASDARFHVENNFLGPKAQIIITNKGQTPAKKISVTWQLWAEDNAQTPVSNTLIESGEGEFGYLAPSVSLEVKSETSSGFDPGQIRAFNEGTMKFFFNGRVEYIDVWEVPRWLTFKAGHRRNRVQTGTNPPVFVTDASTFAVPGGYDGN